MRRHSSAAAPRSTAAGVNRNGICRTLYRLPATGTACTSPLVVRCTPRLVTVFSSQYGCPGPANDPRPLTTYCGR